mgnify:CR=1 FL=1
MTLVDERRHAPAASITPDRLLDAPLQDLLAELDVLLVDSSIRDASFFGAIVERRDGQLVLAMPVGRSEFERDTAARMLLGEVLGVTVIPAPAPLRMEVSI